VEVEGMLLALDVAAVILKGSCDQNNKCLVIATSKKVFHGNDA
jgi:hypothetical protein